MFQFRSRKYQNQHNKLLPAEEIPVAARNWIMRRDQLPEYRFAIEMMDLQEKQQVFWSQWNSLDVYAQRDLARATFGETWYQLIANYHSYTHAEKIQVLEALSYIHNKYVVDFLVNELKRDDDSLRLAASGALTKQDPLLTIEPMMEALAKPQVYLAARIYDVLKSLGPKLVPILLIQVEKVDLPVQIVMVQLLGSFGDDSIIPTLERYALAGEYGLRKVATEALATIGGAKLLPIMSKLLEDESWQIRLLAVETLRKGGFTQIAPQLRQALKKEQDQLVRDMMIGLLYDLEKSQSPVTFLWARNTKRQGTIDGAMDESDGTISS